MTTNSYALSGEEKLLLQSGVVLHQAVKRRRKRSSGGGAGGAMFGLSGDDAGQIVEEEEKDKGKEEEQPRLGGARNSHEVMLHAFDGGGSVESLLLHGLSSSSMVDSSSEKTTAENGGIGSAAASSHDGSLELRVGASPLMMDILPAQTIMEHSAQLGLSSEVYPTVSGSSASTTSGQNFRRVLSQLQLTGLDVPDILEPTAFHSPPVSGGGSGGSRGTDKSDEICSVGDVVLGEPAPARLQDSEIGDEGARFDTNSQPNCVESLGVKRRLADAGAHWMHATTVLKIQKQQPEKAALVSQESSVCAPTDSIGSSHGAPYLGVNSSCALSGISGPPATVGPLFRFPVSQACEEHNMVPDHTRAMLLRASFPSSEGDSVESSRPKRRNVRISKDPQSVAARHRRERISDRIRMLQKLVPGGTKMDTASMLDEAIHYVKFLKLQLQVLEQLGSSFDPYFTVGMPAFQPCSQPDSQCPSGTLRPFDLNCATYQLAAAASSPSANASSTGSQITGWPRVSSSMCLPDHAQEQFCH